MVDDGASCILGAQHRLLLPAAAAVMRRVGPHLRADAGDIRSPTGTGVATGDSLSRLAPALEIHTTGFPHYRHSRIFKLE